jgi:hypothetical protein
MLLPALAIALCGLCSDASAQTQCPEFVRLRNQALDAQKPLRRDMIYGSCVAHVRLAEAWRAVVDYAEENREMCNITEDWVRAFESYRRNAASVRDNICAGRPARAFPADIIQR